MSQDFGGALWIRGRKRYRCDACYGPIPKGETHANYRGMYENEWQNWRMHRECYEGYSADGCGEFMPGDFPMPERIRAMLGEQQEVLP